MKEITKEEKEIKEERRQGMPERQNKDPMEELQPDARAIKELGLRNATLGFQVEKYSDLISKLKYKKTSCDYEHIWNDAVDACVMEIINLLRE